MQKSVHRAEQVEAQLLGANPVRSGDFNQRLVLQAIQAKGTTTGRDIAEQTGLSHQAALNIVKRLSDDGFVIGAGKVSGQRGQPALRLQLNPDGAYALGLNIDRDHLVLVVIDLLGKVRHRVYRDIAYPLPRDVVEFVLQETREIFDKRRIKKEKICGLGIAMPDGIWHHLNDTTPGGYDQWKMVDIGTIVGSLLDLPVFIQNDASASAIGERHLGRGADYKTFVYLVISAGVGCGLIVDGKPFTHGLNHAGEIGNIPVRVTGQRKAILWNALSLFALYETVAAAGVQVSRPEELVESNPVIVAAVKTWIEKAIPAALPALLALNYILSPETVFVGGQLPSFVVENLCRELNAAMDASRTFMPMMSFQSATTSVDAAALGAATVALIGKVFL